LKINYGYKDGSGNFFITIDTEKCIECGKCVDCCPEGVLEMVTNEYDPLEEKIIPAVKEGHRKKIKYSCAPCKSTRRGGSLPCVVACSENAITHSW